MCELAVANNFRQLSGCETPHSIHLKQTILCGHVPLGKKQIVQIVCLNRGDAVIIARNRDWRFQFRNYKRAIEGW